MWLMEYFSFYAIYNTSSCTLHFISDKIRKKRQQNYSGGSFPSRFTSDANMGGTQWGRGRQRLADGLKGRPPCLQLIGLRLLPKEFKYEGAAGGLSFGKALWI